MSTIKEIEDWYRAQCDDEWEHQFGMKIDPLDNPGWSVEIDLKGTNLEGTAAQNRGDCQELRTGVAVRT